MKITVVPADLKVRSNASYTGTMPLNVMYEK